MPTSAPLVTEEMRQQAIGLEGSPVTVEVEKGAIIKFAQAIGDDNPLFNDEVEARRSRYGGLIAPPTFLRSMTSVRPQLPLPCRWKGSWTRAASGVFRTHPRR